MNTKATFELDYTPEELESIIASQVQTAIQSEVKTVSDRLIKAAIEETVNQKVNDWINTSLANYRFEIRENGQVVQQTIEEHMQRVFVLFMNEKIDDYDRVTYDGQKRINRLINKELKSIYDKHIKPSVAQAGQELKASLNEKLKEEVADKMKAILFSK